MNSDSSKVNDCHRNDKTLINILSEMSKTPVINEHENKAQSPNFVAPSSSNNLNVRIYENIHPQDPRIRHQSNHITPPKLERLVWGRMFPESSSPELAVKSENEVKEEGKEPDELTKMKMIFQGNYPSSQQFHVSRCQFTPQPVPTVSAVKEEKTLEESDKLQNFTLLEQRAQYMKKAARLQAKIGILRQRRQELRGDGQRSPSPETKLLLKENTKIQLVHQNKLKNINSLIDMLNGIIGEKAEVAPNTTKTEVTREIKVSPPKRFNYVFYDPELHWCRVCNIFPATATDYLTHLHSQDHKTNVAAAYMEAPWHSTVSDDSFPTHPLADTKRMPIKGLQFFVPSTAWYCKLCDHFIGDLHCASAHLKSVTHSKNYSVFVKENPHWESDWMLDRQKAFEDLRLTVSLAEVDSFNIESINDMESTQNEMKPEKYPSSPTSSSDSDTGSVRKEKVFEKRAKANDIETDPSVSKNTLLKRLEPLITDRKLLDDINSTKVPNNLSPPRSYRDKWEDRWSEARHDDRSLPQDSIGRDRHYRHPSRHNDRQLRHNGTVMRMGYTHDRYPLRYDRSSRARDTRSSERSRLRNSEKRSERERSEVRSERGRSEVRSERSRTGRDSPVYERLSPQTDVSNKRDMLVGKITPFKIKSSNKEETKVLNKEQLINRKEEMDAEIQKKIDEFKEHLIQIQVERQLKKIDASVQSAAPKPSAPTYIDTATTVKANPVHADSFPPSAFTVPPTPAPTDDLDMNQVVEMATQILQQQAMLGVPFGMDPLCMPPPMAPMGGSILGPPPGLPMGMPQPLMQMPFMTPFMGGRLPLPPRAPIRNRKRKSPNPPSCSKQANDKKDKNSDTIYPPGEDK